MFPVIKSYSDWRFQENWFLQSLLANIQETALS